MGIVFFSLFYYFQLIIHETKKNILFYEKRKINKTVSTAK
jgi:hypothetical protein